MTGVLDADTPAPVALARLRSRRILAALEVRALPKAPAALVVVGIVYMRPNIWGSSLTLVSFALAVAAAAVVLLRRGRDPLPADRTSPAMSLVATLVVAACVSGLVKSALMDPMVWVQIAFQDLVLTGGSIVAIVIVAQHPVHRLQIARGFVLIVGVACASYAVTALMWTLLGVGFGEVTQVVVGKFGMQPVFFPFTTTCETQTVLGLELPRFTGIGREPGWMAMYCAAAFFLADSVGLRSRRLKAVLLLGLLGCVSTAGFGVFVVVWAWDRTLRPRGGITLANYSRQVFGLAALPVALWLASDAPILGLSAKKSQNGQSLTEREDATAAGWRALFEHPWGGRGSEAQSGVNLVSDISVDGLVFVLLVTGALLLPILVQRRIAKGTCVALVVFLTMLLSQPPFSSAWAYCLVAVALGCDDLTATDLRRAGVRPARHRRPRRRAPGRPPGTAPTVLPPTANRGAPTPGPVAPTGGRR